MDSEKWDLEKRIDYVTSGRDASWQEVRDCLTAIEQVCTVIRLGFYRSSDEERIRYLQGELDKRLANLFKREKLIEKLSTQLSDLCRRRAAEGRCADSAGHLQAASHSEQ